MGVKATYSILIVDDEQIEREGIKFLLEKFNYPFQIFTQKNGKEALEFVMGTSVDIICSDIKMPFMDGMSFCERAKELNPSVKIIMLTAFNDFEYTKRAIHIQVDDYLMKPIIVSEFQEVMGRLLRELNELQNKREKKRELLQRYKTATPEQKANLLDDILQGIQDSPQDENEQTIISGKNMPDHKAIKIILDYIKDNYTTDLTMDTLAAHVFLSKGYLSNLFKSEVGVSVMQYITMLRMQKAKQLLITTNMKLCDIGEVIGYHNHSYFCQTFKKYYGVTALSFRHGESHDDQ